MNHDKWEVPITDFLYTKASRAKIPLSGTFELSPVCNFACKMCYVRKTAQEVKASPRPIVSKEQWLKIAREARDAGMLFLLLTGGEPLLWPDFWELYDALVDMGILVSINTNGSLIDAAAIEHFRRKPPRRINITLYGSNDATYERLCGVKGVFSRVDRAINGLREAGILVKLNGSFTPYNVGDMEELVAYAESRKLILQTAFYMFPPVRRDSTAFGHNDRFTPEESAKYRLQCYRLQYGEEKYQKFLQSIQNGSAPPPGLDESCIDPLDGSIRCRAGKAAFWITWDGWLTACGLMPEPKVELIDRSFFGAWQELHRICDNVSASGICDKCNNHQLCHACTAMAYSETGSTSGVPIYLCQTVEAMRSIAEAELIQNV